MKILTFPDISELNMYGYSDLSSALESNPTEASENIREVLAYVPGEHERVDYHWLVRLRNYDLAYITGGCDYTGWDCASQLRITEMEKFDPLALPAYDNYNRPLRDLIAFQYQFFDNLGHPEQVLTKLLYEIPEEKVAIFKESEHLLKHLGMRVMDNALVYSKDF